MQKFSFSKMNGAGNDFIIIDEVKNPGQKMNADVIAKLCDRRFGIGADGVMTIADTKEADFAMQYYNSDGSTGTLCGNGSRCALRYYYDTRRPEKQKLSFASLGRTYNGEIVSETEVKFYLAEPGNLQLNLQLSVAGLTCNAHFIDTGSPHVVININEIISDDGRAVYASIQDIPVADLGKQIRWLPEFAPQGTNVNFYELKDGLVFIRTFERGVEDETFACGTGATGTAIITHIVDAVAKPIQLVTKSGKRLKVDFEKSGPAITKVSLSGPAEFNFNGTIII
jgi:diaminopimelate epimerase